MQEIHLSDVGGHSLPPGEIVTDDFIAFVGVSNYNPDLLEPGDPYYKDYNRFQQNINETRVITIDMEQLSKGVLDDMNFNEGEDHSAEYTELKPGFEAMVLQMEQEMRAKNYFFGINNSSQPFFSPVIGSGPMATNVYDIVNGDAEEIWSEPIDPIWALEGGSGPKFVK